MGIAEFAPRALCSDVERRAAVWMHDDLRARGHAAWMETHWIRPELALALALGCALAAIGGLVAIGAPFAGLVIAAVGAVSVLVDVCGRTGPLRMLLPRRATQVVLVATPDAIHARAADEPRVAGAATAEPHAAAAERHAVRAGSAGNAAAEPGAAVDLLVVARTEVPRRGLAARLERVPGGLWWLALAATAVTGAAAARVAGADGLGIGIAQLVPTVVLLLAVGGALDAAVAPVGDGRVEDEAVTAALALHDALVRDPPHGIAAGLLLAGPYALRAHLRRVRLDPARTALLHVRAGDVRSRHPQWLAAAQAEGLAARRRGPRGLPAASAPPEHAEKLARALQPRRVSS